MFLGLDYESLSGTPMKKLKSSHFKIIKDETVENTDNADIEESNSNKVRIHKSAVHEHYQRVKILHPVTEKPIDGAICNYCKSKYATLVATNLKSHLKRKHP